MRAIPTSLKISESEISAVLKSSGAFLKLEAGQEFPRGSMGL